MDYAMDIENLRPVLLRVLQTHQLTPEAVREEGSHVEVSDRGRFECPNCVVQTIGRPYSWYSAFSWLTFDLKRLAIEKKWIMKCAHCLAPCKPYFTLEQIEAMFTKAVRCYKGEKFQPEVNIGYGARRQFRQPHFPELCEKCNWGATRCWYHRHRAAK